MKCPKCDKEMVIDHYEVEKPDTKDEITFKIYVCNNSKCSFNKQLKEIDK